MLHTHNSGHLSPPEAVSNINTHHHDQPQKVNASMRKEMEKHEKMVLNGEFKSLTSQIDAEHIFAEEVLKTRVDEYLVRLKVYNNQKRDKFAIGDPLMFWTHQTILASLYEDRLLTTFEARREIDKEREENINPVADFDYDEMKKSMTDYVWNWDASFFGRAVCLMLEWDSKGEHPIPDILDPTVTYYDPMATSLNGDAFGKGQTRFFGRPIRITRRELRESTVYFNLDRIKDTGGFDQNNPLDRARKMRADASGLTLSLKKGQDLVGDNQEFQILEWFTWWRGKRVLVGLADHKGKKRNWEVVRFFELPNQAKWPGTDRTIYNMPHNWECPSIPDLTEDKQRARARIQNMALLSVESSVYPSYLYDKSKIKPDDINFTFNKHVPVDGSPGGTIEPVNKQLIKQDAQWILEVLDQAAQRATATPEVQQGIVSDSKRTATEIAQVGQNVTTRFSLSAKIFGISEREFWDLWYDAYKENFDKNLSEKIIRITGAKGAEFREFSRDDLIFDFDPRIKIESKVVSESKRINELATWQATADRVMQDPTANKRFILKKSMELAGQPKDVIDMALPPTPDETKANQENEMLSNNEMAPLSLVDDHATHLIENAKAEDTPAKRKHLENHQKALMLLRLRPELISGGLNPDVAQESEIPGSIGPGVPTPADTTGTPSNVREAARGSANIL